MLTIEHVPCQEILTLEDLFCQLGYDFFHADADGDLIFSDAFGIEVKSLDAYYPVEGFRMTSPLENWIIATENDYSLSCASEHLVYLPRVNGWQHVSKCAVGDFVMTSDGISKVVMCHAMCDPKIMFDIQVMVAHSYYTNCILSHNSHFLVQMGAAAMAAGKNVLHYTMELNESVVGIRYDSHICRIPSSDVYDRKDDVVRHYEQNTMGRLIIKEYPTKTPTINTIRAHIEKAILKGITPGLIVIDYADVIRSTKQYDSLRHELQFVYEEVRNLAGEMQIPIWTASQANRDSSNSDIVGLENMSEAYGKAMTADVVISISRKPMEKSKGIGRIFIAKNRAGRDGLVYPCKIDTSMSLIEVIDDVDEETLEQTKASDARALKNELREKWERLSRGERGM